MALRWSDLREGYEFETDALCGGVSPWGNYHGLSGLMHRGELLNIVRPSTSFLNAEYYLMPGSRRQMIPRGLSCRKRTTHELRGRWAIVRFPPESEYGVGMELAYAPEGDAVDMAVLLTPSKAVPGFELFFASYVCEALKETWIPLRRADGAEDWFRLDNRRRVDEVFAVVRDEVELARLDDGRYGEPVSANPQWRVERHRFARPILVARNPASGFTLIFLLDAVGTTLLAGQYHGWDTAHDWAFGADLSPGEPVLFRARLIYRPMTSDEMFGLISSAWAKFVGDGACHEL